MIPYLKIGAAVGCLLVLSVAAGLVYRAGQNSVQVKWEVAKVAHANALIAQESRHRAQERKWGEATTLLVESIRGAQGALQDDYENTIAGIESGTLRLRRDLSGCRDKLSADTPAAHGDNGANSPGLSRARQNVVIRLGADADKVAIRLQAAQRYIRGVCN